jgi:pimeloyl-ACP methyl ester carboxylesterase
VAAEKFMRMLAGDEAWEMLPMRTQQQRRDEGAALLADLQSIRASGSPFAAAQIKVPVLVAVGETTREHHKQGTAVLGEELGVPVRTFAGAGHNGHQSHPGEFAAFCREVLELAQ